MREIRFRGKRIDNGEWIHGFLYRHDPPLHAFGKDPNERPSYFIHKTGFADWNMQRPVDQFEIDEKSIGLSTGLTGMYNKPDFIYESDIVSWKGENYIVEWSERDARFYLAKIFPKHHESGISLPQTHWNMPTDGLFLTIIGNAIDNPELLTP